MRYFSKAIPSRQLMTPRGTPVPFEMIDDRQPAYLATEDAYLVAELLNAISNRRSGISESSELEYAEFVKKKLARKSLPPPSQDRGLSKLLQTRSPRQSQSVAPVAAVASPPPPPPPRVEIATQFPKLGRWRDPTTA